MTHSTSVEVFIDIEGPETHESIASDDVIIWIFSASTHHLQWPTPNSTLPASSVASQDRVLLHAAYYLELNPRLDVESFPIGTMEW